jgi:NADP-dependent 3-hydroxy acid dehydrogenase YdfG
MISLSGQVAVIAGASGGIGRAIALRLAAEGVATCLLARNSDRLQAVADEARSYGSQVVWYAVDLSDQASITALRDKLAESIDRVNILAHCAGAIALGNLAEASIDDLDLQFRVNVRGPYHLTQTLLPWLLASQGQIVFVNSLAGLLRPRQGMAQYAATKHALRAIADSLREELNDKGVRVTSVYPGRTSSAMQAGVHHHEGRAYRPEQLMQPDDVATVVMTALSLPRTAEMTDVSIRPMNKLA